jgi:P-type Ca2+ transporter type 2C
VDPVDPAVMRRPPRKKEAPIITRRLLYRVLFSASLIVIGTLFVYVFALEDDNMSRREQTMVSLLFFCEMALSPGGHLFSSSFNYAHG